MKLCVFATIFLLSGGGGAADKLYRKHFPPTSGELLDYVRKLMAVDEFRRTVAFTGESVGLRWKTVAKALYDVHGHLDDLGKLTTVHAFNFFRAQLIRLCDLAVDLLERKPRDGAFVRLLAENAFGFPYDFDDYCAVTFFFHSKTECPVIGTFALIAFLQTFASREPPPTAAPLRADSLAVEIRKMRNALNVYFDYEDYLPVDAAMELAGFDVSARLPDDESLAALSAIRDQLKSLSKDLCSPAAIPIVDEDLFSSGERARRRADGFVDHAMRKEKCNADFQFSENWIYTRQMSIRRWDCYDILTSPEYGVDCYKKDSQTGERQPQGGDAPAPERGEKCPTAAEPKDDYKPFALQSLKKEVQRNYVGRDLLLYNKVEADAMAFSAVKEGSKMFRATVHLIRLSRKDEEEVVYTAAFALSEKTIDAIRSRLLALRSIFRKFRDAVLEKLLINIDDRGFDRRMDTLLKYLDGEDEGRFLMYNQIERGFFNVSTDDYADDEHEKLAFHEYHFSAPILNVYKLYDLVRPRRAAVV